MLSIIIPKFSNLLFFAQKRLSHSNKSQKYLSDENINLSFYGENENEIFKQIEELIGKQNAEQIKTDLSAIRPIFTERWPKISKNLLSWKQYFQNNEQLFKKIILDIKKITGVRNFTIAKIPIYLISNQSSKEKDINAWFSWTPKESFIVIEIPSSLKPPNDLFSIGILAHEFFHLMLRKNNNLFLKIKNTSEKNDNFLTKPADGMPNRMFLEELLVSSFIPEGYLNKKYLNIKIESIKKPKDLLSWRKFISQILYNTSEKYINNNKQIDAIFLKHLIDAIKCGEK